MIYLDNAATTEPFPEVIDAVVAGMKQYANPSALYDIAHTIQGQFYEIRQRIARMVDTAHNLIYFTSGGTEGNNLAIQGYLNNRQERVVIGTLPFEHKSILDQLVQLKRRGYPVHYLPHQKGTLDVDEVSDFLLEHKITFLILSGGYSEAGVVLPLNQLIPALKARVKNLYVHVDAVQCFGKYNLSIKKGKIDSLVFSGHKLHGPKGSGVLAVAAPRKIEPLFYGGSQNEVLRPGTENVPAILGLGKALEIWEEKGHEFKSKLNELRVLFDAEFDRTFSDDDRVAYLSPRNDAAIISLGLKGVLSENMINFMAGEGIYIAPGSACMKGGLPSFLTPFDVPVVYHKGIIRVSFSVFNQPNEIKQFFKALKEGLSYF